MKPRFALVTVWRWPLMVFLLALAARLTGLGRQAFWHDEIITATRAALPLPALIHAAFVNHHTPVYFLLVAPFAHLPDPQFTLRLPSAMLGALNVVLVFLIARRAGGVAAGIAAALILGLSPTEIAYSQEARSYMLMIFFLLVALHALTRLAQNAERAALPWHAGGLGWAWLQFITGSAAAFCTLADSLLWLLAADITAAVMIVRAKNPPGILRNFLAANVISLGACLPLYLLTVLETGRLHNGITFIPASTPALIWYDIESIYLMRVCDFLSPHFIAVPTPRVFTCMIGIVLGIATLGGIWRLRRSPMLAAALLPAALTLPVAFGVASIVRPLLLVRYLLWSGPPFAILAGIGIAAFLDKWPAARLPALVATSLLLLVNLAPYYDTETKLRWDSAARILAVQAQPQDAAYYSDPIASLTMRYYVPAKLQTYPLFEFAGHDLPQAEQARAQGKRVWAIYGEASNTRDWQSLPDFQTTLAPLGTPTAVMHVGGTITIWRYDP